MNHKRKGGRRWTPLLAALAVLAAAGCGNDAGTSGWATRPGPVRRVAAAPPAHDRGGSFTSAPDPLAPSDPLTPSDAEDPLAKAAVGRTADPLADAGGGLETSPGQTMPTEHSHWLRGDITNARVDVRLNGILLGQFSAHTDKDITMKLHAGVNTVTFTYHPLAPGAAARLNLLESEHAPPIPPLATFQSPKAAPAPDARAEAAAPATTQTTTFIAR